MYCNYCIICDCWLAEQVRYPHLNPWQTAPPASQCQDMNPPHKGDANDARPNQGSREPRHGADNRHNPFNKNPNQHDRFRQHQPNRNPFPPRPQTGQQDHPGSGASAAQTHPQPAPQPATVDLIETPSQIIPPEQSPFDDSVTTAEAIRIYEQSGQPRSERSLQRYCADGSLDCHKSYDANGMTYYLIDRSSIARHLEKLRSNPTVPRPPRSTGYNLATDTGPSTLPATPRGNSAKLEMALTQLSHRLSDTTAERDLLRQQLEKKDAQIEALNTQQLASTGMIQGLQRMIDALTGYMPKPPNNQ